VSLEAKRTAIQRWRADTPMPMLVTSQGNLGRVDVSFLAFTSQRLDMRTARAEATALWLPSQPRQAETFPNFALSHCY